MKNRIGIALMISGSVPMAGCLVLFIWVVTEAAFTGGPEAIVSAAVVWSAILIAAGALVHLRQ